MAECFDDVFASSTFGAFFGAFFCVFGAFFGAFHSLAFSEPLAALWSLRGLSVELLRAVGFFVWSTFIIGGSSVYWSCLVPWVCSLCEVAFFGALRSFSLVVSTFRLLSLIR